MTTTSETAFKPGDLYQHSGVGIKILATATGPLGTKFVLELTGIVRRRLWNANKLQKYLYRSENHGNRSEALDSFAVQITDLAHRGGSARWLNDILVELDQPEIGEAVALIESIVPATYLGVDLFATYPASKQNYQRAKAALAAHGSPISQATMQNKKIKPIQIKSGQLYSKPNGLYASQYGQRDQTVLYVFDTFTGCEGNEFALTRTTQHGYGVGPYELYNVDDLTIDLENQDQTHCSEGMCSRFQLKTLAHEWGDLSRSEQNQKIDELFFRLGEDDDIAQAAVMLRSVYRSPETIDAYMEQVYGMACGDDCDSINDMYVQYRGPVEPGLLDKLAPKVLGSDSKKTESKKQPAAIPVAATMVSTMVTNNSNNTKTIKETKENKMTTANNTGRTGSKKDLLVASAKRGAKVGLADEAGNVILQFADSASGGKLSPYMRTEEGKALVKLVAATLLLHGVDLVSDDEATREQVAAGCGLVVEAATRDFLKPKLAELRKVGLDLARIGAQAGSVSNS